MDHSIFDKIIYVVIWAFAGGLLYRWRGSPGGLRPETQMGFALPYALAVVLYWLPYSEPVAFGLGLLSFTASLLAQLTGHGNFQDLGHFTKPTSSEKVEFLIKWLKPHLPAYWYDVTGSALIGLLITLMPGALMASPFVSLSGALMAPAYMIGWYLWDHDVNLYKYIHEKLYPFIDAPTAIGEYMSGVFLWGAFGIYVTTHINF